VYVSLPMMHTLAAPEKMREIMAEPHAELRVK